MSPVAVSDGRRRLWRSRWAALGAAVAVTFGGGGLFAVSAASPESSVVTLEPVRILDTRDPVNVGLDGPFTSPVAQDLMVTGPVLTTTGTKTVVPTGATGVFLNVTPVGSTAAGFISVRPANATGLPSTSNVNFTVGAINPNAVLVELPVGGADDGKIEITFDAFGAAGPTSDVLVDVVGYTTDAKLVSLQAEVDALNTAQPFTVSNFMNSQTFVNLALNSIPVVTVSVTAPVAGQVAVHSTASVKHFNAGSGVYCGIRLAADPLPAADDGFRQPWGQPTGWNGPGNLAGTRTFDVAAGETVEYALACAEVGSDGGHIFSASLTATFTPAP
jgi:hypothetical protein